VSIPDIFVIKALYDNLVLLESTGLTGWYSQGKEYKNQGKALLIESRAFLVFLDAK
jgi:hypothetical protein